jgi:anti-sigma regulatory factor (Ser/Thr protein kinase)
MRLELSGPSAVHDATIAARGFADGGGAGPDDVARIAIIVEELVNNLYDHAELGVTDVFTIELSLTPAEISLVLIDPGRSFDPRNAALDEVIPRRGGGAGLRLVRAWASSMEYQSAPGRNRLSLRIARLT